jgi:serine phosphatase RsbU (regulator of sigma subunit)
VIKATIKKREDSKVFLIGFVIFILTVFNDVLYRMEIFHNTTDLIEVGLFLFIFSQAYILSSRRSRAYNRLEKLSVKLKTMNENLEDIVKERTEEIETQKEEIALQRYYAEKQKNIIRQQISEIKISFNYALKIQTAAMPKRELLDKMFPNNFILFKPKDIVSGDFYWFKTIEQNNRKVHVVTAADCTGHGVPGAFVSMLGIAFLNEIAQKPELNTPAKILGALREKFRQELKENENAETSSIDMALCMIDNDKKELQFAGAYNPLFIVRNNKLIEIKSTKRPVGSGKFSEKQFYNNTVVLEKNDRLFLFSDGFSDQLGGNKKKKFMKKSFKELLIETSNHPIQKQKEILASEFKEWKGNNEQTDDILIIGIHI